ncbi:MAG: hypothetical protein ED555_02820 [Allomuricauda sp.]|nr:MAG: hypothetical protein ED555_02820 [Allomuricauda sp.]
MKSKRSLIFIFLLAVGLLLANSIEPDTSNYKVLTNDLPNEMTSEQAFHKMMDVLTHERCVNCHPKDNIPKQGDDSHPHYFGMQRGDGNLGYEATKCTTCHQTENNPYSGVPGAPEWSLAPSQMFWEGLSRFQIAASMMDPERNGGRTPEETLHHLTEHALVLWAWTPGVDAEGNPRELPPVPLDEYRAAVEKWFEEGHIIPTE